MNSRFPYCFDSVLSKLLFFLAGLALGGYYCHSFFNALIFSVSFSVCLSGIYLAFTARGKKSTENDLIKRCRSFFLCRDERECLAFFKKHLLKKRNVRQSDDLLIVSGCALFCRIEYEPLRPDDVVSLSFKAARLGVRSAVILCNEAKPECDVVASSLAVKTRVLRLSYAARLVKTLGAENEIPVLDKKKRSLGRFIASAVSSERAKHYFTGALIMLILSATTSFSVYYLASGCLLLTLAIVSKLKKV